VNNKIIGYKFVPCPGIDSCNASADLDYPAPHRVEWEQRSGSTSLQAKSLFHTAYVSLK